jgi:biopolymer transport protein ExbB
MDPSTAAAAPTLLQRWVIDGGIMMVGLVPAAFLTVAYAVQALINLRRGRVCPPDFPARLEAAASSPEALRGFLAASSTSIAAILQNVLQHLEAKPSADPAEVLREEIETECDLLTEQNSQLTVIYTTAPLMGLLGTVFGMLDTFNRFATSKEPSVQELAIGINIALITTAWGLSIAIPAYIVLYLLRRRIASFENILLPGVGAECLRIMRGQAPPAGDAQ